MPCSSRSPASRLDSDGRVNNVAAELSPGDSEIFLATEQVLTQEGRWADAAAYWSLFLVDQPGNGEARRRRVSGNYETRTIKGLTRLPPSRSFDETPPDAPRDDGGKVDGTER